ncbi:MAG TPA: SGNH/GDSL hydrolase family protein [Steroidobacteraceae bacterium]|nr:SGNH/GDSL hydrolase family protein [Steroidobacteraceae bacterium]
MRRMTLYGQLTLALCLLVLGGGAATAWADGSRGFVFFGDSLTDAGNHYIAFGQVTRAPYQPVPIYPYAIGGHHFSNGTTWAEDLTDELDTPLSGEPALRQPGVFTNYAVGRARARPGAPVFPDFDLGTQVGAFLTDFGGQAPAKRTYVIWIGANDLFDALEALQTDPTGATTQAIIQQAIAATAESLQMLWGAGARQFLVLNLADPALTPYVRTLGPLAQGAATQLTAAYNGALAQMLASLGALPQIEIRQFDIDAFLHAVVSSPARYGLRDVQDACLTFGVVTNAVCADPDRYLFWDGIHPTRAGHFLISLAVLRASLTVSLEEREAHPTR